MTEPVQYFQDHFKFRCECQACEDDWPTYSRIASDRPSEKVTSYTIPSLGPSPQYSSLIRYDLK